MRVIIVFVIAVVDIACSLFVINKSVSYMNTLMLINNDDDDKLVQIFIIHNCDCSYWSVISFFITILMPFCVLFLSKCVLTILISGSSGLRRVVHEPSYLEWMMNSAPDLTKANLPSVFYTDRAMKFTSVLFLGSELDLLLANILTYSLFQVWFNDTLTAILLCYVVDWAWTYVRANYGNVRTNLYMTVVSLFEFIPLSLSLLFFASIICRARHWWTCGSSSDGGIRLRCLRKHRTSVQGPAVLFIN